MEKSNNIKLKEAIEKYKEEEKAPGNSYEWYRKMAKSSNKVYIGRLKMSVYKIKGCWYLDKEDFYTAIESHRKIISRIKKNTSDYKQGIIHGVDGDTIETEWGGYKIKKSFRFVWNNYAIFRKKSNGTWYCNECNEIAETDDKIYCQNCGKEV